MIPRRDFLQMAMATTALYGASGFGNWGRLAAQQAMSQNKLLEFDTFGNVSLIHVTDIHAQLKPIYFREPEINIGVGDAFGKVPHITGADFRKMYGINDSKWWSKESETHLRVSNALVRSSGSSEVTEIGLPVIG